jgi:hypothetical protein
LQSELCFNPAQTWQPKLCRFPEFDGWSIVLYSHAIAFIPHELDLGGVTASIVDAEDKDSDDL